MIHDLYKTGDHGAPEEIKDRNGEVVLGLCKKCGRAEIELDGPCSVWIPATEEEAMECHPDAGGKSYYRPR